MIWESLNDLRYVSSPLLLENTGFSLSLQTTFHLSSIVTLYNVQKKHVKKNQDHAFHTQQKLYYSLSKVFPWLLLFLRAIMN